LGVDTDDVRFDPPDEAQIDKECPLKKSSIGTPDIYLGARLRKAPLADGRWCWTQSTSAYISEAVKGAEAWCEEHDLRLPGRCDTPMSPGYRPELDTTTLLSPEDANWFQSGIGALRWAIEIGRIDINQEVSLLASQMAAPREGHLVALLRVFAYLKKHHNSRIPFDPTYPTIDKNAFPENDWKRFYGEAKEAIPPNAPEPKGLPVVIRTYVDADHAGEQLTRRSRTGFIMFLNSAPINWYSKRQGGVEGASFGSEFMAMKTACEVNRGFRYKLRMMGVPIDGPTYIYGDNMSVLHNTQKPESTLKKKSNSIAFHFVRECVSRGEALTGYVNTKSNYADLMTKTLPMGDLRCDLVRGMMWDIYPPKKNG